VCKCSLTTCILNTAPEKASLLLFFSAVFAFKEHHRKQKELERLEQARLGAELGFLRAQVNPHYLFNTLNTIYSCALDQPAKVPELLLKLSHSLRYVLYESEQDRVPLEKEIQHLADYIALQELRLEGRVQVQFTVEGFISGQTIAPLLLIAFVENAFKYCAEFLTREGRINIALAVDGAQLRFRCVNDCLAAAEQAANQPAPAEGGIGLQNVRKRLALAYGKRQQLHISQPAGQFQVDLLINPL
jgi:LytS/YehU family sensor histidine kinase